MRWGIDAMGELTHLDEHGDARMVDVGSKPRSTRRAVARGAVRMSPAAIAAVSEGRVPKGDVLAAARIAGIMAAKRTPELIPLCHHVALSSVGIDLEVDPLAGEIRITAEARARDRTGVEMEALTAVSVAALTLYDMIKAVDRGMQITGIELVEKTGGKGGRWERPLQVVRKTPDPGPVAPPTKGRPVPLPDSVPPRPSALTIELPALDEASAAPVRRQPHPEAQANARRVRVVSSDDPVLERALLERPIDSAYMLGDLDDFHAEHCRWYAVDDGGTFEGVLLHYAGLSMPTVLTKGTAHDVESLLIASAGDLPRRFYCHVRPEHREPFGLFYELDEMREMIRMGLDREDFQPSGESADVEPLTHRDTGAIMRLYHHYPDNFFEPAQLDTGLYFGVRDGDDLVSVAGIHVLNVKHDIAAIGNIVTHSARRTEGLATRCVGRLLDAVFERVSAVALNVQADNDAAIRCYQKFGFAERYRFYEGWAQNR